MDAFVDIEAQGQLIPALTSSWGLSEEADTTSTAHQFGSEILQVHLEGKDDLFLKALQLGLLGWC